VSRQLETCAEDAGHCVLDICTGACELSIGKLIGFVILPILLIIGVTAGICSHCNRKTPSAAQTVVAQTMVAAPTPALMGVMPASPAPAPAPAPMQLMPPVQSKQAPIMAQPVMAAPPGAMPVALAPAQPTGSVRERECGLAIFSSPLPSNLMHLNLPPFISSVAH